MVTVGEPLRIEIKIIDPRLFEWGLPRFQTDMAGAVDIQACIAEPLLVRPQQAPVLVASGFAMHLADLNVAAIIIPRSGAAHKKGLVLGNTVGLIDADYTAEIQISVWNRNPEGHVPIEIRPGERIAQMIFVPVLRPVYTVVEEFARVTTRGSGGFGSTGNGA